jgi:hypothetical protein
MLCALVFGGVLDAAQLARAAVFSYPLFPDVSNTSTVDFLQLSAILMIGFGSGFRVWGRIDPRQPMQKGGGVECAAPRRDGAFGE